MIWDNGKVTLAYGIKSERKEKEGISTIGLYTLDTLFRSHGGRERYIERDRVRDRKRMARLH